MKLLKITLLFIISAFIFSCEDEGNEQVLTAIPVVENLNALRNQVEVQGAKHTAGDGKIYVTEDYLFYIAQEEGVHIFNNQNPDSPQNVAFLNIPGVHDIAVKGNHLFADNFVDLVVFDIANISSIQQINTLEGVVEFWPIFPEEAQYSEYIDYETDEILIGYTLEMREMPSGDYELAGGDNSSAPQEVGQGGSYAKFQINDNALYTVDAFNLNIFNIADPSNVNFVNEVYLEGWFGGELETLFKQKNFLFAGATNGMHIIDATDEFNPTYISTFSHATGCDPVVVEGNTAYITVLGGNSCGAIEDQMNVIDITNEANPTEISTVFLDNPQGLGVRSNVVYVCTGDGGLKIYDATDKENLTLENTINVHAFDVIAMQHRLILVGNQQVTQYNYSDEFGLTEISQIGF